MGVFRATVTAVLMLAVAATAAGQCVSDVRLISTRGAVPNLIAGPLAFGGGVFVVSKFDRSARDLYVATYDEQFNQLTADRLITTDTPDGALALVWNGQGFGLFYRTQSSQRLVLQRLTAAGEPLGTPIPVSSRTIGLAEEVDVTWSDVIGAYAIATTYAPRGLKDVYVTIMDRDGIVRRDEPTNVFAYTEAAWLNVAVTSDGTVGVFYATTDENYVMARLTSAPGAPVDTVWTRGRDLQVVSRGNLFYLVKQVQVTDKTQIRMVVLDSLGHVAQSDRVLVAPTGIDVRPLALLANGEELALAYLDSEFGFLDFPGYYHLRRFTPSGTVIADAVFAAAQPAQGLASSEHDFVWTGTAYVAAVSRNTGKEYDSLLLRLCPLKARITTPRQSVKTTDVVTFTANAEGGVTEYEYTWSSGDTSEPFVGPTFSYRYRRTGTYTVTLTVKDASGVVTTATYQIRVVNEFPRRRAVRK